MPSRLGTFEQIVQFLAEALAPLAEQFHDLDSARVFFAELGVLVPGDDSVLAELQRDVQAAAQVAGELPGRIEALLAAIEAENVGDIVSAGALIYLKIDATLSAIRAVADDLHQLPDQLAGLAAEQQEQLRTAASRLPIWTVNHLVLRLIAQKASLIVRGLGGVGLLDLTEAIPISVEEEIAAHEPEDLVDSVALPARRFLTRELHLNRAERLFRNPEQLIQELTGWGLDTFDHIELFQRIVAFLERPYALNAVVQPLGAPAYLEAGPFIARLDTSARPPGLSFAFDRGASSDSTYTLNLSDTFTLTIARTASYAAGLEARIRPPFDIKLVPPVGEAAFDFRATLATNPQPEPYLLFGQTGKTRIEVAGFSAELRLAAAWDGALAPPAAVVQPSVAFNLDGGKVVVDTSDGDTFLRFLLGDAKGEGQLSLDANWTPQRGLSFDAGSGLSIALPTHGSAGAAAIDTLYLISDLTEDGSLPLELSSAVAARLGPLAVTADRIGIKMVVGFPENGGNLGPIDLDLRFKPPNGIGLRVDGGGVSGGGFLSLAPERGEYAGALELSFEDLVDLAAVGVLETRLPDNPDGFSLLISLSGAFNPPMQLGLGFTLSAIGGLIGLNRTINIDALRAGIRDGSLGSVLFPADLAANAARVINDLKRILPPHPDHVVIGPMARIGWGSPTLVELEVGLLLEPPEAAITLVGILRIVLPDRDDPIARLQVNFVGAVDSERQSLSFDASLYESHILEFPLTGDMAVRALWGDAPNFLLSVGGFHPSFEPPPLGLPELSRLSISIFSGNPKVRAESYFAVTSNTVQFGALAELYFDAEIVDVYGFVSLDVLIQLDPFHFIADVAAMLAVRAGGSTLFSVCLQFTLEGPTPWHARGRASFEVSFIISIEISVRFNVTVGEARRQVLAPVRLLPLLIAALEEERSWEAIHPIEHAPQVTLRDLSAESTLVFNPAGTLVVSQKAVPLNLPLQRFGARRVEGGGQLSITRCQVGGQTVETLARTEKFAPGQFLEQTDAERLSRSFCEFAAGIEVVASSRAETSFMRGMDVTYEVVYLPQRIKAGLFALAASMLGAMLMWSAAGRSRLSAQKKAPSPLGTPKVTIAGETFVVASTVDLKPFAPGVFYKSEPEAAAALQNLVANDNTLKGRLQVVPSYEAAA